MIVLKKNNYDDKNQLHNKNHTNRNPLMYQVIKHENKIGTQL